MHSIVRKLTNTIITQFYMYKKKKKTFNLSTATSILIVEHAEAAEYNCQ